MIRNPRVRRRIHGQNVTAIAIDAHRDTGPAMRAFQGRTLDPYVNRLARAYGATGQGRALMNQQVNEPASGAGILSTISEYGNKLIELPGAALDALQGEATEKRNDAGNAITDTTWGKWDRFLADLKKNAVPIAIATGVVLIGVPMLARRL